MDDIKIDGIYDFDSINNKQIALGIADCISNWSRDQKVTCLGEEQSSTGEGPRPDEVEGWSTSKIVLQSSILMLKGSSNLWSSLAFLKKNYSLHYGIQSKSLPFITKLKVWSVFSLVKCLTELTTPLTVGYSVPVIKDHIQAFKSLVKLR